MTSLKTNLKNFDFVLKDPDRRLGLVILATDHVLEDEFRLIFSKCPSVSLFSNRIRNETTINHKTLNDMANRLEDTVSDILPGMPMDAIAYACTSASLVIGYVSRKITNDIVLLWTFYRPSRITEICQKAKPNVKVTNPLTAAIAAIKKLNVHELGLVTPYREELNNQLAQHFEKEGIKVTAMVSFNNEDDNIVGRISCESIEKACQQIGSSQVDGVFVSCTNMRILEKIHNLEETLGIPVTSSNHAMAWHLLQLVDMTVSNDNWGTLFRN